jgi:hypothetical protein
MPLHVMEQPPRFFDSLTEFLTPAFIRLKSQIWYIDIQIVRPEMTKFKIFREKVNMDFYSVGITF